MTDDVAAFASTLPERYRYSVVSALRQTVEAGIRWGYLTRNPAKLAGRNPQPPPRGARVYTPAELKALVEELDARDGAAVRFAAATGLRPAEWAHARAQGRRPETQGRAGARNEDGPLEA